ncbi:MAG: hypothetical protein K0Q50_918 [Vampirovibrio sp.]|jgi:hypothetical protein|nr:hypothetical protein [Vampirovibrio sp.]
MSIRKGMLGVLAAVSVASLLPASGFSQTATPSTTATTTTTSQTVDILRSVPLEVKDYASARSFPERFTTTEQIINALNSTPVLLVHMEAIRRGYHELPISEHEKLLTSLHKRRSTNENDLMLGFDHGYAQLVFKQNKTGLFFLRKANDKIQDQFSNLAYAMAEAEADINLEGAKPEETTTRKMDVTYKLGDAVKLDAAKHQPGFWPSYVRVIEKLKPMPAYKSFTRRDFSLAYVPYGNSVVPLKGTNTSSIPLTNNSATLLSNSLGTSCNPDESAQEANVSGGNSGGNIVAQRSANFNGNAALIQFTATEESHLYRVRVLGAAGNPMLSFKTYALPNIVEDLDGDGTFEIVARQYQYNPLLPALVYRYTPCGFELDKQIHEKFQ